jgi:hypothetical protein
MNPVSGSSSISFGLWKNSSAVKQYTDIVYFPTPYTCFTFPVSLTKTCDPATSQYSLNSYGCRSVMRGRQRRTVALSKFRDCK